VILFAAPTLAAPEYVIVTPEAFAAEFQPLADWRTAHGLSAEVRTVEWITAHYPGGDDAEKVRNFIQDAYASLGTMWVLLGGDAESVPVRYARTTILGGVDILSDYYFMCLDGNWNADGDPYFGELEDQVDLAPEVFAGRSPVSTALEARAFVQRTIEYETHAPEVGYPASALLLAEQLLPNLHGATIAEGVAAFLPPAFIVQRLYAQAAQWPGAFELTRAATLQELNAGYGFVLHVGSENATSWSLGDAPLTIPDVQGLGNAPRVPMVYAFAGKTAQFDLDDAIGEHWLTSPGGGVAYIGCTNFGFVGTGTSLLNEWARGVFTGPGLRIGAANALARVPLVQQAQVEGAARWMLFTLTLLGDPALALRREATTAVDPSAAGPVPDVALTDLAPNPFSGEISIGFDLARAATGAQLSVYDASGRLRRQLFSGPLASGPHAVRWNGEGPDGEVPPGVYFIRLDANGASATRKIARLP
jgi:hypothetical protein